MSIQSCKRTIFESKPRQVNTIEENYPNKTNLFSSRQTMIIKQRAERRSDLVVLDLANHTMETSVSSDKSQCHCRCCNLCQERYAKEESGTKCREFQQAKHESDTTKASSRKDCLDLENAKHFTAQQNKTVFEEKKYHNFIRNRTAKLLSTVKIDPSISASTTRPTLSLFSKKLLSLLVVNSILSHLSQFYLYQRLSTNSAQIAYSRMTPKMFAFAEEDTTTDYCNEDYDCKDGERFCHENKCMCPRERPIEDKERSVCLPLALINEACYMDNQCLSDAKCIEGVCACSSDYISLFNPSTKVYYCHPKRRLNEDCNHDSQCPDNAFCSTKKHGCLCQNGYGSALMKNNGAETILCLPKACKSSSDCESEYHFCDEQKCKCLATHFDPHNALCYKFGSTGGSSDQVNESSGNVTNIQSGDKGSDFESILKDLTMIGDRMWSFIIALILLTIILLALMVCLVRKYCLGYCWTAHKKEYEPNNENVAKKEHQFDKNSINNKSFRRKRGELYDDDDDEQTENTAADRSNLVKGVVNKNNRQMSKINSRSPFKSNNNSGSNDNQYVKVDMPSTYSTQDSNQQYYNAAEQQYQPSHQIHNRPLASSTSTPV